MKALAQNLLETYTLDEAVCEWLEFYLLSGREIKEAALIEMLNGIQRRRGYYPKPSIEQAVPTPITTPALPRVAFNNPTQFTQPPVPGYQPPMLGIAHPVLVPAKPSTNRTPAEYFHTDYYQEARKLVEDSKVDATLASGCTLVLTLLLSWLHFPLFKNRGWLLFGTDRMRRELAMRNDHLLTYIKELQRAGLIQAQALCAGGITAEEVQHLKNDLVRLTPELGKEFWQPRIVQAKTTIYRLGKDIELPKLSEFNPWEGLTTRPSRNGGKDFLTSQKDTGRTEKDWEQASKAREGVNLASNSTGKELQPLKQGSGRLRKDFPRPQLIALKEGEGGEKAGFTQIQGKAIKSRLRSGIKKTIQPLFPKAIVQELENERKLKLLQNVHRRFEPFEFDPIHPNVMAEFVQNYSLTYLQERFNNLEIDWQTGKGNISNPVGIYVSRVRDTVGSYTLTPEQIKAIREEQAHKRGINKQKENTRADNCSAASFNSKSYQSKKAQSGGIDFSKYTQPGGKYYNLAQRNPLDLGEIVDQAGA